MAGRLKTFFLCIMLLSGITTTVIDAQILKDTASVRQIKRCIDNIYNFQFGDANTVFNSIRQLYPEHPVVFLLKGMMTYWEHYPLLPASPACELFEKNLKNCIELCEKKYDPSDEAEYLLANLSARGMLLLFYYDNDLRLDVFPLATSTYRYVRRCYNFTSVYSDFYFFTGLYDYSREAYPEAYPIYKPLAMLFPRGDKIKGIKDLQIAAYTSIVLKAESLSFLSEIFIRFENNYLEANSYNKALHELYPSNLLYMEEYLKNLLLIKQYEMAEKFIISSGSTSNNLFFKAQLNIFNGIIKEKRYHDYEKAQELYLKGVRDITPFGNYGNEFAAYAYYGLSRISEANGDKNYKKLYRKTANELAALKEINFD